MTGKTPGRIAADAFQADYIRTLERQRAELKQQTDETLRAYRAEIDRLREQRAAVTAQLDAVRASRERLLDDLGWIYGYSDDPAVLDRARLAVEAARAEDIEPLRTTDGPESNDSGRNLPSAPDDTDDTPEAAAGLSAPQEGAAS